MKVIFENMLQAHRNENKFGAEKTYKGKKRCSVEDKISFYFCSFSIELKVIFENMLQAHRNENKFGEEGGNFSYSLVYPTLMLRTT